MENPNYDQKLTLSDMSLSATQSYSDNMADITRQQWEDYKERFLPVQRDLLSLATSDQLLNEQLDRNQTNLARSFNSSEKDEQIRMNRYGLSPDNSKQDSNNNQLLKNLTLASVNNETRQAVDDLQNKIITGQGGAPKTLADIGAK